MSDETVTKWRCICRRTFDDPYEADKHAQEADHETVREIEVEPAPETRATSLTDYSSEVDR
jgi:hypothetical protein